MNISFCLCASARVMLDSGIGSDTRRTSLWPAIASPRHGELGTWGWIIKALTGLLTTTRLERRREYAEEARDERSEYCVMCKANHAIAHLESLTDIAKKVRGTHLEIVEVIRADTFVLGIRPPEPRIIDSPCSDSDSSRASACQETLSCTAAFATALAGQ